MIWSGRVWEVRGGLMCARHRLSKLLLRQGIIYSGGKSWTGVHDAWLWWQRFELSGLQLAYETGYDTVVVTTDRRDRLGGAVEAMAADSEFTSVVRRLGCLRGVATLTGFALAVEIGDWHRLTGRSIGAYLGPVPTESSCGDSRSQGGVTKTGNGHARRLLVEAAWKHRARYQPSSRGIRARWDLAGVPARQRGHAGDQRLYARWQAFDARAKKPVVANAVIARELAAWCWSLAVLEE